VTQNAPQALPLDGAKSFDEGSHELVPLVNPPWATTQMSIGIERVKAGHSFRWRLGGSGDADDFGERDEVYFVIEGRIRLTWEDGELVAGRRTAIHFPLGRTYEVTCEEDAEILYAMTPAIVVEKYLEEA